MLKFNKIYTRFLKKIEYDLEVNPTSSNKIKLSFGGKIGKQCIIRNAVLLGNIVVDDDCKIIDGVKIVGDSLVEIGRFTSLNGPNMDIRAKLNNVRVGAFCSIARNVSIQEYNHKMSRVSSYYMVKNIFHGKIKDDITSKGNIVIGNDVWVGAHSLILSGAKIGNGAVIAANSVVTGSVPPYAIAGGSPAKIISYRFSKSIVKKLQDLKWWDWSIDQIRKNRDFFLCEDADLLEAKLDKLLND